MKIYVFAILLVDSLNTAFNIGWIYMVLINQFGNLEALAEADWRACILVSEEEKGTDQLLQCLHRKRLWQV